MSQAYRMITQLEEITLKIWLR